LKILEGSNFSSLGFATPGLVLDAGAAPGAAKGKNGGDPSVFPMRSQFTLEESA